MYELSLCVCVVGVSGAMNELRPCAPVRLKHIIAQELIKGLRAVSDSLLRYNTTRMLRENESVLFLSLCRAFIEVRTYYKLELMVSLLLVIICIITDFRFSYKTSCNAFPCCAGCFSALCHMLWSLLRRWSFTYHRFQGFVWWNPCNSIHL